MAEATQHIEADALAYDPFAGDFGMPGDRWLRNAIVTARKAHPCFECTQQINPGERTRIIAAIFDGEFFSYRWCQLCTEAMAISWTDNGKALDARHKLRGTH